MYYSWLGMCTEGGLISSLAWFYGIYAAKKEEILLRGVMAGWVGWVSSAEKNREKGRSRNFDISLAGRGGKQGREDKFAFPPFFWHKKSKVPEEDFFCFGLFLLFCTIVTK